MNGERGEKSLKSSLRGVEVKSKLGFTSMSASDIDSLELLHLQLMDRETEINVWCGLRFLREAEW